MIRLVLVSCTAGLIACSNGRVRFREQEPAPTNFEQQIDECAAAARDGWTERGAIEACDRIEPAVWQLFEKQLRHSVTVGPMYYGLDCDRGLRAMRSGFFERHRAVITTFCNQNDKHGLWPDAFR